MTEVIKLADHRPCEPLADLTIYRQPDGSILLGLTYMADAQIESVETIGERFAMVAQWLRDGIPSLLEQAQEIEQ